MKHILIDGTTISMRMDGLSQYILNVTSRLPEREDKQYHVVVRPGECPESYLEVWRQRGMVIHTASIAPIGVRREWQFYRWLKTQRPFDAVIAPSNQYPIALHAPSVYVVHDIIYEQYPSQLGKGARLKRLWLHFNVAQGLKRSSRVVAVSRYTKSELLRFHPSVDPNKIEVIYEGWEHLQQHAGDAKVDIPFTDYILYIGSSRGHKNLEGLINALVSCKDAIPAGKGVVIAGDDRMLNSAQRAKIESMRGKVITTGWLSPEALDGCYRRAKAVIIPSLCEGFGIPVLETFYYQKPLLVSNASSLPEVAGDAGMYFDPTQPQQMAQCMLKALSMTEEQDREWIEKGDQRLRVFSWQQTADRIEQIIDNL